MVVEQLRDAGVRAPDGGVIEDARARERRHRRIGGALVVAALVAGALIAGMSGGGGGGSLGGHAGGRPSGSGAGAGTAHPSESGAFPGAPATQPNGYGVASRACPLAAANRYLPARSGCVTAIRADLNGDGRPDLILVYSRLGRRIPSSWYAGGVPASLRHDFVADAAYLKVVLAGGGSASVEIAGAWAGAVDAVAHLDGTPSSEVLLEVSRISSGASDVAYGLSNGPLVPAGVTLFAGGDSAAKSGFDCVPGNPPRLIQRTFELIGPTVYGWWRETSVIYAWHGPRLVQISSHTFKRRGVVPASEIGIGHTCITGLH
jgi:hypothetical protein